MDARTLPMSDEDYLRLAAFRAALRKFLRSSEEIAQELGVTPQKYQALLGIRGFPGDMPPTISDLAARLHVRHNSAVGLVTRIEQEGYVRREKSALDHRRIHVHLTPKGHAMLNRLAEAHREELRRIGPEISRLITELAG